VTSLLEVGDDRAALRSTCFLILQDVLHCPSYTLLRSSCSITLSFFHSIAQSLLSSLLISLHYCFISSGSWLSSTSFRPAQIFQTSCFHLSTISLYPSFLRRFRLRSINSSHSFAVGTKIYTRQRYSNSSTYPLPHHEALLSTPVSRRPLTNIQSFLTGPGLKTFTTVPNHFIQN
jgi:hypothetical protein